MKIEIKTLMLDRNKVNLFLLRIVLLIILCSVLIIVNLMGKIRFISDLREDDVASRSIYSPIDFTYNGPIDELKTRQAKKEAAKKALSVYSRQALKLGPELMARLQGAVNEGLKDSHYKSQAVESIYSIVFSDSLFLNLDEKKRLRDNNVERVIIFDPANNSSKEYLLADIKTVPDGRDEINKTLAKEKLSKKEKDEVFSLISSAIRPNIFFDAEKTDKIRGELENSVSPIYSQINVKKNELIIDKGQVVTKAQLSKIKALSGVYSHRELLPFYLGISILLITFLIVSAIFLRIYFSKVYFSNKELILLSVLFLLCVALGKALEFSPFSSFSVPVAAFPMVYFMLTTNPAVAFVFAALLSIVMGITLSNNIGLLITFFICSITGITAVFKVRRRSHIIQAGLLVGCVQFIAMLGWGVFNNLDYDLILRQALESSFWNSLGTVAILMIVLPILEALFGLVTNITLLELSDFNQPLLKDMVLKAPGTYHHSLMVGNLSEAAAESIGANSLLARVGAYFHDIGKVEKAEYFSENQYDQENKHNVLNPSMSKLVIMNHVKEGVDLAKKYRLRQPITDFILQHHGTSLVYYFYRRALEERDASQDIKEEGFRYLGPKPQTKETAICLLADSVEAAARAIEEPTASKIEDAVHTVINNKFIDGQLDECDLKLKDLEKIARVFTRILTGIYHNRVVYPENKNGTVYKEQPKQDFNIKRNGKENRKIDSL
jgi:putative nucleotidyltransferase with HDIG domain